MDLPRWGGEEELGRVGEGICIQNMLYEKKSMFNLKKENCIPAG